MDEFNSGWMDGHTVITVNWSYDWQDGTFYDSESFESWDAALAKVKALSIEFSEEIVSIKVN